MVTIDDVRALTVGLPRSYEASVRGRVKFRVGQIVYLAFARRGMMGFAFPKEERGALIQTWPEKFMQPDPGTSVTTGSTSAWTRSTSRAARRSSLTWRMVVPKRLAAASDDDLRLGQSD